MEDRYAVYMHIFPNGKRYVGISKRPEQRWANGNGYKSQGKVWNAIKHYGWDNIKHEIVVGNLRKDQAEIIEKALIEAWDSVENGYNTSVGGKEIKATFLNAHVLQMICESDKYDVLYDEKPSQDSIVTIAKGAKYHKEIAEYFNYADGLIEEKYNEYKRYYGSSLFHDFGMLRVDCYWWTMAQVLTKNKDVLNNMERGLNPYWQEYISRNIKEMQWN